MDLLDSGGAGGFWDRDRAFAGGAGGSMFVQPCFDMVPFQRTGRGSHHLSDGNGSMLKTWATDLIRGSEV